MKLRDLLSATDLSAVECALHILGNLSKGRLQVIVLAGMARFTCHDPRSVWDLVPCDTVASAILLTAATVISQACAIRFPFT